MRPVILDALNHPELRVVEAHRGRIVERRRGQNRRHPNRVDLTDAAIAAGRNAIQIERLLVILWIGAVDLVDGDADAKHAAEVNQLAHLLGDAVGFVGLFDGVQNARVGAFAIVHRHVIALPDCVARRHRASFINEPMLGDYGRDLIADEALRRVPVELGIGNAWVLQEVLERRIIGTIHRLVAG